MSNKDRSDPLHLKEWFSRSYSVPVSIILFFLVMVLPGWLWLVSWYDNVYAGNVGLSDASFFRVLTFIIVLLFTDIIYMLLQDKVDTCSILRAQKEQLEYSEERFKKILDMIPGVAVQGFAPDGSIFYWNLASERLYGFASEEVMDRDIRDVLFSPERALDLFGSLEHNQFIPLSEYLFLSRDRTDIPVLASYACINVCEGHHEIFSMQVDLSERKKAESLLLNAKLLAEASSRTKDEFMSNMNHEFKTPLNAVIGFSDLLLTLRNDNLSDKQKQYIQNISNGGKRLLGLVDNIMELSDIEAEKLDLSCEKVSLPVLIASVVDMLSQASIDRDISVNVELDPDVLEMEADSSKLKMVLYHLLSNAIKFSDVSGQVHIRTLKKEDSVLFEVEDNGIGIDQGLIETIFDPFNQADSSRARKYEGSGLGLFLARKFVEMHNGVISVESVQGQFSIFRFKLPQRAFVSMEKD